MRTGKKEVKLSAENPKMPTHIHAITRKVQQGCNIQYEYTKNLLYFYAWSISNPN